MLPFADLSVDVALRAGKDCASTKHCKLCCCDVHVLGQEDRIMYRLEAWLRLLCQGHPLDVLVCASMCCRQQRGRMAFDRSACRTRSNIRCHSTSWRARGRIFTVASYRMGPGKGRKKRGVAHIPTRRHSELRIYTGHRTLDHGKPGSHRARIVEGLITGMGFIGGGAILVVKASVRGTATAASLWATGAIGTSVGLGAYDVAIVLSVMTFLTLRLNANLKPDGPENKPD